MPSPDELARLLGVSPATIVAVEDLTRGWATTTRSLLVTTGGGGRLVVQLGAPSRASRSAVARRMRVGEALAVRAPRLGVTDVLGGDPLASPGPWLATRYVEGTSGSELLDDDAGAARLGAAAGAVARAIAAVSPAGLGLSRRWAAAGTLQAVAAGWVSAVAVEGARPLLARIPAILEASPPALAHGDLAPVNLVIRGGRVTGLLDLERARIAPAAFDAAWFRLMILVHHPERWGAAGPAFLAARGFSDDARTAALLDDLAALACLELAAGARAGSSLRGTWSARAAGALRGEAATWGREPLNG